MVDMTTTTTLDMRVAKKHDNGGGNKEDEKEDQITIFINEKISIDIVYESLVINNYKK